MSSASPAIEAGEPHRASRRVTALILAVVLLASLALRLAWLDRLPWGLHADEVAPSLSALDALAGRLPFTLPEYNIWLHAASFWLLGVSPLAVRLLPALAGSFFPVSVYLALRQMFGRRVALIASLLAAAAVWPLVLSRSGFSISYLPVVLCLFLWQLQAGWQTGRARNWFAAGFLLAAAQYIYFPARAVIGVVALSAVYLWRFFPRERLRGAWPLLAAFILAVVPLFWRPVELDAETTRYSTVFILAQQNNPGNPVLALARQAWLAVSMFFYQGDSNFRHNALSQPVFNPLVAVFALVGLIVLLRDWRRPTNLFWWLWMGSMLVPMFLSIESPHFLRAAGILPLCFALPALGLDQVMRLADLRGRPRLGLAALVVALAFSLANTVNAYFGPAYTRSSELYHAFNGNETDLAVTINRFLEVGWKGSGVLATHTVPRPGRTVLIDQQLWNDRFRQAAIRLLVPLVPNATPGFGILQPSLAQAAAPSAEQEMRLILLPGHEQPAVALLPFNRLIRVEDGPLTPHGLAAPPAYRTYTATRLESPPARPLACFQDGIELVSADLRPETQALGVDLTWRAQAKPGYDYTVFTHVLAQGELVGQVDGYPVLGRYLTSWWRAGDLISDDRSVPIPNGTALDEAFVRVGLYRLDTHSNLAASDCAGNALGDFVLLPITPVP